MDHLIFLCMHVLVAQQKEPCAVQWLTSKTIDSEFDSHWTTYAFGLFLDWAKISE